MGVHKTLKRLRTWAWCITFLAFSSCSDASIPLAPDAPLLADASGPDVAASPAEEDVLLPPEKEPEYLPKAFELYGVEPGSGPTTGGEEVLVTGKGFIPGMVVLFDQSPALGLFVLHEGLAVMRAPPHPAGRVDVWLYHDDIDWGAPRILESAFLYAATVEVAEITPNHGDVLGGDAVTVIGTGFDPTSRFFIRGHLAIDQSVVDEHTLTGFTPPGAAGGADVHVVNLSGTFKRAKGFTYGQAPAVDQLTPPAGPAQGGTLIRFVGQGLGPESSVFFDDDEATVVGAAPDQTWLDVVSPAGPAGTSSDVMVLTPWGAATLPDSFVWIDPAVDPYLLACSSVFPTSGSSLGAETVTVVAAGLQYGVEVAFGNAPAPAPAVSALQQSLTVATPAHPAGTVDVTLTTPYGAVVCPNPFEFLASPTTSIAAILPNQGKVDGGDPITLVGEGFDGAPALFIGAMAATEVTVVSPTQITATTPPGTPGLADVRLIQSGQLVTLKNAFEYASDTLSLDLIAPNVVARSGGTFLRLYGTAFTPDATVTINETPATMVAFISSSELHFRSPKLEVGTYDATVATAAGTATLGSAITVYDPQSGYSGTWGGPIDETLNVTVRGTHKFGPIAGSFVLVERQGLPELYGYTDENGQITFSEPGLYGPLSASASHPDFDAYSVLDFDATNLTIYLRPKNLGPGQPPPTWPPAILSGQVLGLGKYVIPPPGSCAGMQIAETEHCKPCSEQLPCQGALSACADIKDEGTFCLMACLETADCPEGYMCGPAMGGTRCMPAPGEKIAKCMISNSSPFATEPPIVDSGWVEPGGYYELPSGRLGDLAVVCFGGYLAEGDVFTPTVMGVRRHVFAEPAAIMTGLDVSLNIPLKKTLRLRMMDPPTWPGGVEDPSVTLSLDLGSDGAIPMSRTLIFAGDDTWLAPRQVGKLEGNLYDATYFFYTRIYAKTQMKQPATFSLISGITTASETRLPLFKEGAWELELSPVKHDLHGIWGASSDALYAVGDKGTMLLFSGNTWTSQTSGTSHRLRAIAGRSASDIWAVGDQGTVRHFTGGGWNAVTAPLDSYGDVATAPGQPVYVAGTTRIRRFDENSWSVEGPAWVQGVRAISLRADGAMAAVGSLGHLFLREPDGTWTFVDTGVSSTLRAVLHLGNEVVAVGDDGVLLEHAIGGNTSLVQTTTERALLALTVDSQGQVIVVGDDGAVMHRVDGVWAEETLTDYRSAAYDIFAPSDGGPVRVVGSSAFIIGPLLHFPAITAPVHDGDMVTPTMAWTWDGGLDNQVTRLRLFSDVGKLQWTFVVKGDTQQFTLPNMPLFMGYAPLDAGKKRLDISRIYNTNFDIDNYTSREWSIYRRDSWSNNRSYFISK